MDVQVSSGVRAPHIQGTQETDKALLGHCGYSSEDTRQGEQKKAT
jgi:hypothetical protein